MVFFIRRKEEDKGGPASFCTGFMRVEAKLTEQDATDLFGRRWRAKYEKEISERGRKRRRRENIILGERSHSFWLGANGIDLRSYIRTSFGIIRIPTYRNEKILRRLEKTLKRRWNEKGFQEMSDGTKTMRSGCTNKRAV